jgi:hypothetical protein
MNDTFLLLVELLLIYLNSHACICSYQPGSTHITLNNRVIEPQEFSPFSLIETLSKETRTYGRLLSKIHVELISDELYHSFIFAIPLTSHSHTHAHTDSMPLEYPPTLPPAS